MYHKQRHRLLKKDMTVEELQQELWAMFGPNVELDHEGPISLQRSGEQPLFTLRDFESGDTLFKLNFGDRSIGDFVFSGSGLDFEPSETDPVVVVAETAESTGSGAIPGIIVSGSGDTYQVQLFENGVTQATTRTVEVKQLQIDAAASIPASREVAVYEGTDNVFWMQHPVWGE